MRGFIIFVALAFTASLSARDDRRPLVEPPELSTKDEELAPGLEELAPDKHDVVELTTALNKYIAEKGFLPDKDAYEEKLIHSRALDEEVDEAQSSKAVSDTEDQIVLDDYYCAGGHGDGCDLRRGSVARGREGILETARRLEALDDRSAGEADRGEFCRTGTKGLIQVEDMLRRFTSILYGDASTDLYVPSTLWARAADAPTCCCVERWVLWLLALSHVACFAGGLILGDRRRAA